MLDAVDKVIKTLFVKLLKIDDRKVPVYVLGSDDSTDQPYSQAGMTDEKPDTIDLPFVTLFRLPTIDITDSHMTKRVHNYTGYKLTVGSQPILTYYRTTLHYSASVFAENRKLSEDIATSLYGRVRNYCQIKVNIQLPIELEPGKFAAAPMDCDIELGATIEQVNPLGYDKAQVYRCRFMFDVKNVNIYHTTEEKPFKFDIYVQGIDILDNGCRLEGPYELIYKGINDEEVQY